VAVVSCLVGLYIPHSGRNLIQGERLTLSEGSDDEEHEEEEEEEVDWMSESTSVYSIIVFLIVVTIMFEKTKDIVEERATKDMLPIIESLFGEMTILGFLSVITFICTKVGILEMLSVNIFGEGEETKEKLTEIFETVHYCLFAIMIFFVIQVIVLVKLGTESEAQWLALDRACQDPGTLELMLEGSHAHGRVSPPPLTGPGLGITHETKKRQAIEDQKLFHALRQEFILNRDVKYPFKPEDKESQVGKDFNYGRYLSMCMGETLAEVVEVSVPTWACMGVLASLFYLLMLVVKDDTRILAWSMCACGWLVTVFNFVFERKLIAIRNSFAPIGFLRRHKSIWTDGRDQKGELQSLVADENKPGWCSINPELFNLEGRSKTAKHWFGPAPNRQQLMFWGQQYGPEFHILLLRITLLFNGLYTALMAVTFIPDALNEFSRPEFICFVIAAVIPLYLQVTGKRRMVGTLTHIGCIGCLRRNEKIADVIREGKTSSAVRAFIVLHKIHMATKNPASVKSPTGRKASGPSKPKKHYSETMPDHMLQDISKTFDLFDDDGSGAITTAELSSLMESLGTPQDPAQLGVMIALLDANGDGDISKEEFIQWYSEQLEKNELDPEEMAKSMFSMFDADGSGSITIAEFKEALDAFNVGLSLDDITELVKELDEDRNGHIDEHEFAHLLKRHSHPPPELTSLAGMY
jgi:calmodulin